MPRPEQSKVAQNPALKAAHEAKSRAVREVIRLREEIEAIARALDGKLPKVAAEVWQIVQESKDRSVL